MSDLNIFLSALQTAFNTAVKAAVEEARAPLHNQVQCMDTDIAALKERIAALENQAIVTSNAVDTRIAALENNPAQGVDTQAAPAADITRHIIDALSDTEHPLFKRMSSFMDAVAEQAMDDHTNTYDHDSYDNAVSTVEDYDFEDFIKKGDGDLEDAIRDTIRNMTFEAR